MKGFKIGDRVVAKESTARDWERQIIRDKIYIVKKHPDYTNDVVVFGEVSPNYWGNPHNYFDKIKSNIIIGGEVL